MSGFGEETDPAGYATHPSCELAEKAELLETVSPRTRSSLT